MILEPPQIIAIGGLKGEDTMALKRLQDFVGDCYIDTHPIENGELIVEPGYKTAHVRFYTIFLIFPF